MIYRIHIRPEHVAAAGGGWRSDEVATKEMRATHVIGSTCKGAYAQQNTVLRRGLLFGFFTSQRNQNKKKLKIQGCVR
jgi:hypothetical protein